MTIDVDGFRARFPEFSAVADERVEIALSDALPEVSSSRWGSLYDRGVYNLAAHILKISETLASGGSVDDLAPVSVRTVGDVSVSLGTYLTMVNEAEGLNLTPYGREYFRLRKLVSTGGLAIE